MSNVILCGPLHVELDVKMCNIVAWSTAGHHLEISINLLLGQLRAESMVSTLLANGVSKYSKGATANIAVCNVTLNLVSNVGMS